MQCLVKSAVSLAVHSPFGFSFIASHQSSLPTSGAHAEIRTSNAKLLNTFFILIPNMLVIDGISLNGTDNYC